METFSRTSGVRAKALMSPSRHTFAGCKSLRTLNPKDHQHRDLIWNFPLRGRNNREEKVTQMGFILYCCPTLHCFPIVSGTLRTEMQHSYYPYFFLGFAEVPGSAMAAVGCEVPITKGASRVTENLYSSVLDMVFRSTFPSGSGGQKWQHSDGQTCSRGQFWASTVHQ